MYATMCMSFTGVRTLASAQIFHLLKDTQILLGGVVALLCNKTACSAAPRWSSGSSKLLRRNQSPAESMCVCGGGGGELYHALQVSLVSK